MLANQIWSTTLSAAIVFRYTCFWSEKHGELAVLAIDKKKVKIQLGFDLLVYACRTCGINGLFVHNKQKHKLERE